MGSTNIRDFLPGTFIHVDFAHIPALNAQPSSQASEQVISGLSTSTLADSLQLCHTGAPSMASNSVSSSKTDSHMLLVSQLKLDNIKKKHNLAKAVKSDDAEVSVHLWNETVFFGPPTPAQSGAASFLRSRLIRYYRCWLLKDYRLYLRTLHDENWYDKKSKAQGK